MGYYKVLSKPAVGCVPHYKGLFRFEVFPSSDEENLLMSLWQKYVQYNDKSPGVTTYLTLDELKELALLSTQVTGDCHEVIYFDEAFGCPHQAEYYGIDVTNFGGYSIGGENFFRDSDDHSKRVYHFLPDEINKHFETKLNANGLFRTLEDAIRFRTALNDLVADEDWRVFHIFRVGND